MASKFTTIYVSADTDKKEAIHTAIVEAMKKMEREGEIESSDWDISGLDIDGGEEKKDIPTDSLSKYIHFDQGMDQEDGSTIYKAYCKWCATSPALMKDWFKVTPNTPASELITHLKEKHGIGIGDEEEDEPRRHQAGCVCVECAGGELTAEND